MCEYVVFDMTRTVSRNSGGRFNFISCYNISTRKKKNFSKCLS